MSYTISENAHFNSREIIFDAKPSTETREALKALKMRWNPSRSVWYGFASAEAITAALNGAPVAGATAKSEPKPKAEPVNADGVKVGDLFYCSWGYEQTNIDYYQVIALKGKHTAIIKEIGAEYIGGYSWSGKCRPMRDAFAPNAEEYTVRTQTGGGVGGVYIKAPEHSGHYLWPTSDNSTHDYSTYA